LFSIQQRLWADHHLIVILGIFINKILLGFSAWADEFQNPAQQQALDVACHFCGHPTNLKNE